ncbi:hypothetical protein P691DRAFT_764917 [Macrolepiota fuliginosa MF-IS2]|uniref:Nephrocystin 3-like N-terminal domain-containing protein n=1 Tax=Macrolepiota fuliginosa MF-IS2 TaxID=1400762 RepID=A0A9P5X3U6_9AGAR|nr:hypothetical protein P691DRAFT_764917 [Macrolepiota fuliginosa MF-IS2]
MQTLAKTVSTYATLFFSRYSDPPCNDSMRVFTTFACSLTVANDDYYKYIEIRLSKDPAFLDKSLTEQFNRLSVVPFTDNTVKAGGQRWAVLLDGLDECKNEQNDQCRILDLISGSISHHPGATPFVWVIASRPEAHLMNTLRRLKESFRDRPTKF